MPGGRGSRKGLTSWRWNARCALLVLAGSLGFAAAAPGSELFDITEFPQEGRSVAAELADLDGDGRTDMFVVRLEGMPPAEKRTIRVHLQDADGNLPATPSHVIPAPRWGSVYDVADVLPDVPGAELVVLGPHGPTLLSLGSPSGASRNLQAPGPTTMGPAEDERGFEPFPMVHHRFGPRPWILVPQIGRLTALTADGRVKAALDVPRRANYFIMPETGLVSVEADFQVFLDAPKLAVGDVDGDGQADVVASTRHEIRVFLRRPDGSFSSEPDRLLPLGLVTPRDHIRGSGGVDSEVKDLDGDGRLDLLISHVRGSFQDAETHIRVHRNHGGGWNLEAPDQTLSSDASIGSNALFDLDGDGRLELVRIEIDVSVLEIVELLLSSALDVHISFHRLDEENRFGTEPFRRKKLSVPFSFDTFRSRGFIPKLSVDLNQDGYLDFVGSGGGEEFEVYAGSANGPFERDREHQKMETAGVIQFGDIDGDRLPDFVLFDPHHFDVPVRVGLNRGGLEGMPPMLSPAD